MNCCSKTYIFIIVAIVFEKHIHFFIEIKINKYHFNKKKEQISSILKKLNINNHTINNHSKRLLFYIFYALH